MPCPDHGQRRGSDDMRLLSGPRPLFAGLVACIPARRSSPEGGPTRAVTFAVTFVAPSALFGVGCATERWCGLATVDRRRTVVSVSNGGVASRPPPNEQFQGIYCNMDLELLQCAARSGAGGGGGRGGICLFIFLSPESQAFQRLSRESLFALIASSTSPCAERMSLLAEGTSVPVWCFLALWCTCTYTYVWCTYIHVDMTYTCIHKYECYMHEHAHYMYFMYNMYYMLHSTTPVRCTSDYFGVPACNRSRLYIYTRTMYDTDMYYMSLIWGHDADAPARSDKRKPSADPAHTRAAKRRDSRHDRHEVRRSALVSPHTRARNPPQFRTSRAPKSRADTSALMCGRTYVCTCVRYVHVIRRARGVRFLRARGEICAEERGGLQRGTDDSRAREFT
eukprot:gene39-biopygen7536